MLTGGMFALGIVPHRLRMLAAAVLLAVSCAGQRFVYHGWCVWPSDGELFRFLAFPALFFVAFVWLTAELLGRALSFVRLPRLVTWPVTTLAALAIYVAIAAVFWQANATPVDAADDTHPRALISFFWSVAILVETGNFSDYSCGY